MAHATCNTTTGLKFQYMLDYINSVPGYGYLFQEDLSNGE